MQLSKIEKRDVDTTESAFFFYLYWKRLSDASELYSDGY